MGYMNEQLCFSLIRIKMVADKNAEVPKSQFQTGAASRVLCSRQISSGLYFKAQAHLLCSPVQPGIRWQRQEISRLINAQ